MNLAGEGFDAQISYPRAAPSTRPVGGTQTGGGIYGPNLAKNIKKGKFYDGRRNG